MQGAWIRYIMGKYYMSIVNQQARGNHSLYILGDT